MTANEVSKTVIGCAIAVHKGLGPGLLESAYHECLYYKIRQAGLAVEKEYPMPLVFEEVRLDCGYRIDLLIEGNLIVEVKSVEAFKDVHMAQILTYMRLANIGLGLLLNFNVYRLAGGGIKRVVL